MSAAGWIAIAFVALFLAPTMVMSSVIYRVLLVRDRPEKWGRDASMPDDEEYNRLYAQANAWGEQYADRKRDVEVASDGLRLYGEYFDFGGDRAVIVIPGRTESCRYCYHYAEPYRRAGWNVLAIDTRAHGRSEGRVNSLGYREYRDILAWAALLHDELGNRGVVLHGICIGASTAVFALTAPDCPDYVSGMVGDGMYQRFFDSFKNHMLKDRRPLFPFLWETMIYIRLISGADVVWDGPIKRMPRLRKPILFLHSREDIFSTPEKAQQLYDRCASPRKRLCWFDHGGHSRVRLNNTEAYDGAVRAFLADTQP